MSSGKVVLGALAGLAAGAILGILFAPDKGSTTRKQILDRGGDYADKLKEKFERTKKEAEELASKGKAKYDEVKKEVKNSASEVRNANTSNYNS